MPNARRLPNSIVVINAVCILGVISFLALTKRQAWAPVTRDLGFWFEDALLGLETDLDRNGNAHSNSFPASWSSWGDSTVYSVDTNSYHPSRPAAFGPHVTSNDGLTGRLIPIHVFTSVEDPDNYGCPRQDSIDPQTWSLSKSVTHRPHPPANWIALIKRGSCSFANKVRLAASLGATAVVVGNNEPKDHLGDVMGALIGMWSPGDTSDISIPSVFVSTNSYLDLLRVYQGSSQQHGGDQTDGVVVVLSKDRLVQWDLTDLLVLLLFLPSVMTFFTLLSHRLRMFRQERQQRAPRQLVESIPWVKWGEDFEKPAAPLNQADQAAVEASASTSQDLEAATVPLHQSLSTSISLWWHRVKLWCTKSVADDGLIDQLKNPPLPFSSIKSARLFASQSDCAICLSDFEQGEAVRCLPCGHLLHAACCDPWFLNTNRCCPICRVSVDLKPSDASGARQSQEDVVDPTEHTPLLAT